VCSSDLGRIEVRRVRYVENVPTNLQTQPLCEFEDLCQAEISAQIFVGSQHVALPALSGSGKPEESDGLIRVGKKIGGSLAAAPVQGTFYVLCARAWADGQS